MDQQQKKLSAPDDDEEFGNDLFEKQQMTEQTFSTFEPQMVEQTFIGQLPSRPHISRMAHGKPPVEFLEEDDFDDTEVVLQEAEGGWNNAWCSATMGGSCSYDDNNVCKRCHVSRADKQAGKS